MKKTRKQIALTLLLLASGMGAQAQIYVGEGEENEFRNTTEENGLWNNVIVHGSQDDQTNYTPTGGGIVLLTALGGAYLLKKRKNNIQRIDK